MFGDNGVRKTPSWSFEYLVITYFLLLYGFVLMWFDGDFKGMTVKEAVMELFVPMLVMGLVGRFLLTAQLKQFPGIKSIKGWLLKVAVESAVLFLLGRWVLLSGFLKR